MPAATSRGVAGATAFKAVGGVAAGGALLSTIVVMLMTPPRSTREWAVGVISTMVTGIGGGAIPFLKHAFLCNEKTNKLQK